MNASRAMVPAAWCWPWPSAGVPLKMDTMMSGLNRRTTSTTSASSVSRGQCRNVTSADLENPKS
jgi:hypothetical protein